MSLSAIHKNFRDGTLVLSDNTGTPITLTVQFEKGDFALSGLNDGEYEESVYLDRGEIAGVRRTNRRPAQGSFTCHATDISDATAKCVLDAVRKTGAFSAGVSTLGKSPAIAGDKWTLDGVFTIAGTSLGDSADHTITMPKMSFTGDFSEGDPDTFSLKFEVYGAITMT